MPGTSIRGVVKEFGVSECPLRFRLKKANNGEKPRKAGRKWVFLKEVENELAKCIGIVFNYGFNPSLYEIQVSTLHLYWFISLRPHTAKYIYQHIWRHQWGEGEALSHFDFFCILRESRQFFFCHGGRAGSEFTISRLTSYLSMIYRLPIGKFYGT